MVPDQKEAKPEAVLGRVQLKCTVPRQGPMVLECRRTSSDGRRLDAGAGTEIRTNLECDSESIR
jgi:hypothetical protein